MDVDGVGFLAESAPEFSRLKTTQVTEKITFVRFIKGAEESSILSRDGIPWHACSEWSALSPWSLVFIQQFTHNADCDSEILVDGGNWKMPICFQEVVCLEGSVFLEEHSCGLVAPGLNLEPGVTS